MQNRLLLELLALLIYLNIGFIECLEIKGSIAAIDDAVANKVLVDGIKEVFSDQNLQFTLDLSDGIHTLQVLSHSYDYERIRIDVSDQKSAEFYYLPIGWDLSATGPPLHSLDNLKPRSKIEYFTERPKFNVWSLLGNPMLLMSAVSLAMVFLIPKLKDSITDPELLKELEERQKKNPGNPAGLPEMPDFATNFADYFSKQQQVSKEKKRN